MACSCADYRDGINGYVVVPIGLFKVVLGYFLGHAHKGRQFQSNIHSNFAPWLLTIIFFQVSFGILLKGHYNTPTFGKILSFVVPVHSIMGKLIPVLSYVQIVFGGITALGFCRGGYTGQCAAHFIMGSGFIGYGIVMTLMMIFGQEWLKRQGKSMDFYDSAVICIWGFVNTFTEHRWNEAWSHKDLQHTSIGIIWWAAGLLGIFSSQRNGPSRTFVPSLVIILTGWAMNQHAQHLEISTKVHAAFGWSLIGAGCFKILENILKESSPNENGKIESYQYLPPFARYVCGFC
ncbi:Protein YTP1 [Neolecta irregularis DAH-3]|uniref:Protein YTP1 n=1 Tax=Neolecta irregularis (strain DAH-3) TaxID=1198029 RepID=A0A1U7LPJ4_NEOID|nr:Protein YTP1 [Neolecta irregularis DAH-3]|eukprot:OLL24575.1 Protein YTP1 [Neolecta irregularis DAH-3]